MVADGLRHGTERWRRLDPSHCACHGDRNELRLSGDPRQDQGQMQAVRWSQEHAVEAVLDVVLAQSGQSKLGVGVADVS